MYCNHASACRWETLEIKHDLEKWCFFEILIAIVAECAFKKRLEKIVQIMKQMYVERVGIGTFVKRVIVRLHENFVLN